MNPQNATAGNSRYGGEIAMREFHFGSRRPREDHAITATVSVWAASRGPVDTRWHAVRRAGGGALAALCGTYVYGPVHLRRAGFPDGEADREVCGGCAALLATACVRPQHRSSCRRFRWAA
ncbi:hypothetical protein GCM10027271_54390 [Saccharopolyspora gloriosae]|uniref:Uncharacterized protein n=1 Tax=Saccharopolyspora gloriosae TaxID=455344 RepID=A0A840NKN1_9PSEU|nr:hypothetical protein [Saccharopolyspora gloriosae]